MFELEMHKSLKIPRNSFIAVFLLHAKSQKDSFYKAYVDMLPQKFSTFPIFFKKNLLSELKGSPFLEIIKQK
jgi:hypothetical protein